MQHVTKQTQPGSTSVTDLDLAEVQFCHPNILEDYLNSWEMGFQCKVKIKLEQQLLKPNATFLHDVYS